MTTRKPPPSKSLSLNTRTLFYSNTTRNPYEGEGKPKNTRGDRNRNLGMPLESEQMHTEEEEEEERGGDQGSGRGNDGKAPSCDRPGSLLPPSNFAMVEAGVYRSALPKQENFSFLERLKLKSILYLCPEEYPEENREFIMSNEIRILKFGIDGNKDPMVSIPVDTIMEALAVLIDVRHHPLLIHCKSGKHRTGCLVGCYRKLQNWNISFVQEEYRRYASSKARLSDLSFIQGFDVLRFRQFSFSVSSQRNAVDSQDKHPYQKDNS